MNNTGRLKRFVLFTAANRNARKDYVRSFNTCAEAVAEAGKLKKDSPMRWQVLDNESSKVVAEDPGAEAVPAQPAAEATS